MVFLNGKYQKYLLKVTNLEREDHVFIVPLAGQGKIYFEVAAVSVLMQNLHPSAIFYGCTAWFV